VEPGQREPCPRVIEFGPEPLRGGMAHRTIGREARRFVIRIGCVVVVVDVARGTVRRRPGELAVDMALLARHVNVEPGQRELSGRVVIKLSPQPGGSVVTGDAGGGEACPLVVRVRRPVVVVDVTGSAVLTQAGKFPIDVAARASQSRVEPGQGESRLRMVEFRP